MGFLLMAFELYIQWGKNFMAKIIVLYGLFQGQNANLGAAIIMKKLLSLGERDQSDSKTFNSTDGPSLIMFFCPC